MCACRVDGIGIRSNDGGDLDEASVPECTYKGRVATDLLQSAPDF
jgi:hypothetical protein